MNRPNMMPNTGEMEISGPEFEVGEIVIPVKDYAKSRDLDKQLKALTEAGGGKILKAEVVKRFPEYAPNKEYTRMLEFAGGVRIAAIWFKKVSE